MIYLTGQLLFFLIVTTFIGFVAGWLLRGAMLPLSMFDGRDIMYQTESRADRTGFVVRPSNHLKTEQGPKFDHVKP